MKTIGIIDYTVGNIGSIMNAFSYIGYDPFLVKTKKDIKSSKLLVLPGVGSFGSGMQGLKNLSLIDELNYQVTYNKKPILGLCLGMQLFFTSSEEDKTLNGLGWINGKIEKLSNVKNQFPIPHVGWSDVVWKNNSILSPDKRKSCFYFVHSYGLLNEPDNCYIECTTNYGQNIITGVRKENIVGLQFHPEKSQDDGLNLLQQWVSEFNG